MIGKLKICNTRVLLVQSIHNSGTKVTDEGNVFFLNFRDVGSNVSNANLILHGYANTFL